MGLFRQSKAPLGCLITKMIQIFSFFYFFKKVACSLLLPSASKAAKLIDLLSWRMIQYGCFRLDLTGSSHAPLVPANFHMGRSVATKKCTRLTVSCGKGDAGNLFNVYFLLIRKIRTVFVIVVTKPCSTQIEIYLVRAYFI